MSAVKPQYGPTLVQMLAPRPLAVRIAAGALAALLVVAAAYAVLTRHSGETFVLERQPVTFNLVYGPQFKRAATPGTLLALTNRSAGGLFLDSYVVRELRLAPYRGAVGGMLPVYADGYLKRQQRRYPGYEFVSEGRTRVNNGIGYALTFRSKRHGRTFYERHLLLVPQAPDGMRRGVVIELESTAAAGTPNAVEIGNHGALKMALRSFRFGEDRTGGTS